MKTLLRLYLLSVTALALHAEVGDAVRYLEREVPKWKRENNCYSCHNNGDGLRALIAYRAFDIESLRALRKPGEWEAKPLARLQFAVAVHDAYQAGLIDRLALEMAGDAVAADQQLDGHWRVEEELSVGSPVTYGPVLATYLARQVLGDRYPERVRRATEWLAERKSQHIMETAVLALALKRDSDREALLAAQSNDGSWGGEAFDTALARMALGREHPASIKARAWLMKTQWSGGGWPATTRPGGGDSYAQHISTTAWVLLSLAVTVPQ